VAVVCSAETDDWASCSALASGTVDATTVGMGAEALRPASEAASDAELTASAGVEIMVYP
jgi:hypothetical protein